MGIGIAIGVAIGVAFALAFRAVGRRRGGGDVPDAPDSDDLEN
jgi:NhaP-type Na+/H+ or K+/H+ antiporter